MEPLSSSNVCNTHLSENNPHIAYTTLIQDPVTKKQPNLDEKLFRAKSNKGSTISLHSVSLKIGIFTMLTKYNS